MKYKFYNYIMGVLGCMLLLGMVSGTVNAQEESIPKVENPALASLSYDARLSEYPYPFEVNYYKFQSQGQDLEMAYMYLPGNGTLPVVTLLHGKNFNGAYWESIARYLNKQGYGVLIPDQIGFGKSSKPTAYQYSFAGMAFHTHELLFHLKISRSIIVGHSMGGMLATRFALMYPKTSLKLVLINPIGLENYLQYVEYKDIDFFYRRELKQNADRIIYYQTNNYYDGKWNEEYEKLAEPLIGMMQGPDKQQLAKVSALTYDMIFTQPVIDELWTLRIPFAMILGTRDRTAPGQQWKRDDAMHELGQYDRLGESTHARQPVLNLYELEGLGHLPHIEDFQRFKPVFDKALKLMDMPGQKSKH